jgi:hypothetical protein
MPVTVIPMAELLRDMVQQALGEDRKASDHIPVSLALRWFSDAYRELVRRVQFLTATYTTDLTTSVTQAAPADILDRLTLGEQALRVLSTAGRWHPLTLRDWDYYRRVSSHLTTLNTAHPGDPVLWTWDETTPGQILVLPPSPAAVTQGFSLDYIQDPGPLTRLYDDDTALCAVVFGSATVTFAASVAGLVQAGDVFGVKADLQQLPDAWYKVLSVAGDGLTITLSEPWAASSNATALFTLSQVSPCEWKRPGLCTFAPVAYALFKYWEREDQARSINYRIAFYGGTVPQKKGLPLQVPGECQRVAQACSDRPGLKAQTTNTIQAYAGVRSRH